MLEIFEEAALLAGEAIMDVYHVGHSIKHKADRSPVTEADERAEQIILEVLNRHQKHVPVVAEEAISSGFAPNIEGRSFILVDPLDGTKEFINRRDEFTVNIALIERGVPVCGIVYAPALRVIYLADRTGAWKRRIGRSSERETNEPISVRKAGPVCVAVASRSHHTCETDEFLKAANISETKSIGSSLKFCLVAEGTADVYPRFGRTMEWDTAAGDAVLRAAGGITRTTDGSVLRYGKAATGEIGAFVNPHFVACAS